ncbi:hypothetical protein [Paenibacillus sp. JSM ZJ436]|uniref:hypothetical protein n=1 Tax=Paenibacillus sp. JSM ZJ436 TaxID=3376190 RepID=UPI0037CA537E
MKELEQIIKGKVGKALLNNVAPTVKEVMKDKIEEEVYSVYTPVPVEDGGYDRQRENDGLLDEDNMEVTVLNDTVLTVENIRSDGDRNVAEIVETGEGYQFEFPYNGVPRPFTEATREHLRDTNEHVAAMYRGLVKEGLNVKVK